MKVRIKIAAVSIICLFAVTNLFSQQRLFDNIKITPRWVPDPGIRADSAVSHPESNNLRWLELDIDYNTVAMKQGWLDNVVFKYDILLPQTTKRKVILSGKVTYWSIQMDGKTHHAQAFIHPKFLMRYAPGLRLRRSELKELRIQLTILQNESPVGIGVYQPSSKITYKVVIKEIRAALAMRQTYKSANSVFGRDETPWGVLNTSYYELIKRKQ